MSEQLHRFIPDMMPEFGRRTAVAILTGSLALGLTACNDSPQHETPSPTAQQLLADPDLLRGLYPELPAAVKKAAAGVVRIEEDITQQVDIVRSGGRITAGHRKLAYRSDYPGVLDGANGSGSVVRINPGASNSVIKAILTDAHVAIADSDHCAETTIQQLGTDGDYTIVHAARKQALDYKGTPATKKVQSPDKAVITDNDDSRPSIPLTSDNHIVPGQVAFSANYMPLQNGKPREPIDQEVTKYPAEYSMLALGTDPTTNMEVFLERGRSYGALNDTRSRQGASGGPVILPDGTEYGLTTAVYTQLDTKTEAAAIDQVAANTEDPEVSDMLRNITPEAGDGLVLVQSVTQKEVDRLYRQAELAEPCTIRPHERVYVTR